MSKSYAVLAGAVLGLGFIINLHATPALLSPQPVPADSIVSIVADAQGLTRVPPEQVPPFGTFWLVSPGFGGCLTAPLPCPPTDPTMPIYSITDGIYLVDGMCGPVLPPLRPGQLATSEAVNAALEAQANAVVNLIAQVQTAVANQQRRMLARAMGLDVPLPGGGGYGDGDYPLAEYPTLIIDTNRLWLEMITVTNKTASLVIHPPSGVSNEVYELLYTTNLLVPPTNWQWVLRSYPQETNLIVPNAKDAQGFYRLRSPDDLVANDSRGTNFWLMFPGVFYNGGAHLSLYISSPVGATGTMTFPGITFNGPVLFVTNCGDAALNGTYVLTNLTAQEQTDWQNNGLDATAVGYVDGTNWVDFSGGNSILFGYDSDTGFCLVLYDKPGINLNGSSTNWRVIYGDPSLQPPTTVCPQLVSNQSFTVPAGTVTNIDMDLGLIMVDYDNVETNSVHITTSQPVSVYALDYDQLASTAFTGYPTVLLGTNYCVLARPSWLNGDHSELAILATADNTTVNITPSPTANLEGHANYFTTNLFEGATYQVHSLYATEDDLGNDVTGTLITSDKPIAVFAGASLAYVPDTNTYYANPLIQQQMPVDSWGKQALAISFAGRTGGDSYRVLAAMTNTIVFTNGAVAGTNQAGQFLDLIIDGPVEFRGSQPMQVAHFANGINFDYALSGDPCEILLPGTAHYLMTNIVATPQGFDTNYLNIIVAQSAITNTFVDGFLVPTNNFVPIGSSGYWGAQVPATNGMHTVTSSHPVGVEIYGFGYQDAYGYFGGVVK